MSFEDDIKMAHDDGYDDGYMEGKDDGYEGGYIKGKEDTMNKVREAWDNFQRDIHSEMDFHTASHHFQNKLKLSWSANELGLEEGKE